MPNTIRITITPTMTMSVQQAILQAAATEASSTGAEIEIYMAKGHYAHIDLSCLARCAYSVMPTSTIGSEAPPQ